MTQGTGAHRNWQLLTWGHPTVGHSGDPKKRISLVVLALHLEVEALLGDTKGGPTP